MKLGNFVSTHKVITLLTDAIPVTVKQDGEMKFTKRNWPFDDGTVPAPPDFISIYPEKDGEPLVELAQNFAPIVMGEGSAMKLFIPPDVVQYFEFMHGGFSAFKFKVRIPRIVFSRTMGQLRPSEVKALTGMAYDIIGEVGRRDPKIADRLSKKVGQGGGSIDNLLNIELIFRFPELQKFVEKSNQDQRVKRLSMLTGLPVEYIVSIRDDVPMGGEILTEVEIELGIIEPPKKEEDNDDADDDDDLLDSGYDLPKANLNGSGSISRIKPPVEVKASVIDTEDDEDDDDEEEDSLDIIKKATSKRKKRKKAEPAKAEVVEEPEEEIEEVEEIDEDDLEETDEEEVEELEDIDSELDDDDEAEEESDEPVEVSDPIEEDTVGSRRRRAGAGRRRRAATASE